MRQVALASGNVCFDQVNGRLCLAHRIASGLAQVAYAMSGTTEAARFAAPPVKGHRGLRQTARLGRGVLELADGE
jgi:hypothetical protein